MALIKLLGATQKIKKAKETIKESTATIKESVQSIRKETGLDKTLDKLIQKAKMENILIVKTRSASLGTIAKLLCGNTDISDAADDGNQCKVVTKEGAEVFVSDMEMTILTDRDILTVYDTRNEKRKIGTIKQWFISGGIPLLEREAKTCTVTLGKDKLCDLKKYISFGELRIETIEGKVEVKIKSEDNFSIYYKGKKIAELHELPMKAKDGFVDRYVLEYKEDKDIQVAVMMTIAIDIINT